MGKQLRRATAKADPLYINIVDLCISRLEDYGHFSKERVATDAGIAVFIDAIRWDYVRDMIEQECEIDLIPMAAVFFKRNLRMNGRDTRHGRAHPPQTFPARYMATGNGKKTAGYAVADRRNDHFVVCRIQVKKKRVLGAQAAVIKHEQRAAVLPDRFQRTRRLSAP